MAIGPRVAGTPGGARAREYIVERAARKITGAQVQVRPFEADTPHGRLSMANVVAVLPGARPDVIMLAGHYDTKLFREFRVRRRQRRRLQRGAAARAGPAPGARPSDDYTYWLVWFDGEEARGTWTATDSLYGSRQLAAELAQSSRLPRAMILVDMIGDRDLVHPSRGALGAVADRHHLGAAARLGHGRHFLRDADAGGGRPRAVPAGSACRPRC